MSQRWRLVLGAAAAVVFGLILRVAAQPFSDTPTNHWAYDAIAELAAKGLIQGYPDGTFTGDRSMTRYEMAIVVARLLTRIESIRIPAPPTAQKPEVTKADIDMVLRLMNEFRAELTAQDVRSQAVEKELNAIKARLEAKTIQITGAAELRYDVSRAATGNPLNGNPNTGNVSAGSSPTGNMAREVIRLQFDAIVADNLHFIAVLLTNGHEGTESSTGFVAFNSSDFGFPGTHVLGILDVAFLDWKNAFGLPLEIWLGRFGGAEPGTTYPVQFGPFGLLMNTTGDTWEDATGDSGFSSADGLRLALHLPNLADLQFQAVVIRVNGNIGATSYPSAEDAYGADLNVRVAPGLRLGAYYVANSITQSGSAPFSQPDGAISFRYHVYGPGGSSVNPVTANCPLAVGATGPVGITCPAAGDGFGSYIQWDLAKGIHLDGEWAQWNDTVLGGSDSGYQVVVTWNLGNLLGISHVETTLTTGYQYYGPNFYPPYGAAELDPFAWDFIYPGNAQGFTATLSVIPWEHVTVYADYLTGQNLSNQMPLTEYEVGVIYNFTPGASVKVLYRDLTMGGVDQQNTLRAMFDYRF